MWETYMDDDDEGRYFWPNKRHNGSFSMNVAKKRKKKSRKKIDFFLYAYLSSCCSSWFLEDHKSSKTAFFKVYFYDNKHSRSRKLSKVSHTSQGGTLSPRKGGGILGRLNWSWSHARLPSTFEKYVRVQIWKVSHSPTLKVRVEQISVLSRWYR